jgi:hypothetical protein
MQDLTLVGVHDDGEHLVFAGPEGHKFRVRVDEPLRAAVRRDRPRLGQLQIQLEGTLRPRDIQARIRAGESAEDIAEESGIPVGHIRRYEGPVLAEREFVVRQARAVRMRGISRLDGTVPTLGELVTERLAAREVQHGESSWDAWRSEDGSWVVALGFTAGTRERRARWTYDAQLRHVVPQDDEARWLTDHEPPAASPGAATHRRLVPIRSTDPLRSPEEAVQDHVYDVEADGAVRPTAWPAASTVDLLDTLRERRGRRQRPIADLDDVDDLDPCDLDLPSSPPEPPAAHPARSRPELAVDAEVLTLPEAPVVVPDQQPNGADRATGSAVVAAPATAPVPTRRGKRASVPSWDDIVFGGRRE